MTDQHEAATYLPFATHTRSDGVDCCPHATPVAPGSCKHCWGLHQTGCDSCWGRRLPIEPPRLTPNLDGGWLLHLPDITHLDTQVWSVDIGLTDEALAALRDALNEHAERSQP